MNATSIDCLFVAPTLNCKETIISPVPLYLLSTSMLLLFLKLLLAFHLVIDGLGYCPSHSFDFMGSLVSLLFGFSVCTKNGPAVHIVL